MSRNRFTIGFISSIHKNNLEPYYITTEDNEEIRFIDADGNKRYLNALTIEAGGTTYIQLLPSDYCVVVNGSISLSNLEVDAIKVLADAGKKIRWYGCYF